MPVCSLQKNYTLRDKPKHHLIANPEACHKLLLFIYPNYISAGPIL